MCGIAGAVHAPGLAPPSRELLARMAERLHHRGPDGSGVHVDGNAGLAHRRLSIIDLTGGAQPMCTEDGDLSIVFNGEMYNFQIVRADLESRGHTFRTQSDTEVILAAYREWGRACITRFNGMFALALWDRTRRCLFAARDRLGKKPFYYAASEKRLLFASELKALLEVPDLARDVNPAALHEFLSRSIIGGGRTIYRDVRSLPPGHMLEWREGALTIERYWTLRFEPDDPARAEDDYLEELTERLRESVRLRMISDVPLGAFLSGGIDSSIVVALMASLSSRPVKTFTIGFDEPGYNEIEDARVVARHLGTDHAEHVVKPDAIGILGDLAWHYDEPFGDSSMIPTYYVCAMARREATVALSGDGGDEVFAGYVRYRRALEARRWSRIPSWVRRGLVGPVAAALPMEAPARNFLHAIAHHRPEAPGYHLGIYPYIREDLLAPEFKRQAAAAWAAEPAVPAAAPLPDDLVTRLQAMDTAAYLPEDILVKVDRASMAHSLEVRAPFLDHNLVEFMARVPRSLKLRDGVSKYLLRRLGRRLLPESVFTKPKQGFAVPKGSWFQRELRSVARERLLDPRALSRGYFRPKKVEMILRAHDAGTRDYSDWIWCLLVLEEWHRTFLDPDTRRV